jgi:hypothetical protein
MKNAQLKLGILCFFCLSFLFLTTASAQKITPEEIAAKHLESIGTKDKRSQVKNQLIFHDVKFKQTGSTQIYNGKGLILSENNKNLWGMNLNSNDYPQDQFGYNGKETKVAFARPGVRSALGGFIRSNPDLLKQGLLGGALTSSWALLNTDSKKYRLKYAGTKNVDDKDVHVLEFLPKGGSDLEIKMYFDPQTFHHIRTEYTQVIAAAQGPSVDSSAGQTPSRFRIVEEFGKFTKMGDLTLPGSYRIFYNYSRNATIQESEWIFNVTNFAFNQQLETNSFEVDVK